MKMIASLLFLVFTISPVRSTVLPQRIQANSLTPLNITASSKSGQGPCLSFDILDGNPCNNKGDEEATCTVDGTGNSFSCSCSLGWSFVAKSCIDLCQIIDGTDGNPCNNFGDKGSACITTKTGDLACSCSKGWQFAGGSCSGACYVADQTDGNPCNNLGDSCATCNAISDSSYVCSCSAGWYSVNGQCVDVDECLTSNICGPCGTCHNLPGDYFCSCNKGYKVSPDGKKCNSILASWLDFFDLN